MQMFQDSSPLHSDLSDFPRPNLTVDLILMTIEEDALQILMLERGSEPFKGHLTLLVALCIRQKRSMIPPSGCCRTKRIL